MFLVYPHPLPPSPSSSTILKQTTFWNFTTILRMSDLWEQDFLKYDIQNPSPEKLLQKSRILIFKYSGQMLDTISPFWRVALYINVLMILRNLHVTTNLNLHLPNLIDSGTLYFQQILFISNGRNIKREYLQCLLGTYCVPGFASIFL